MRVFAKIIGYGLVLLLVAAAIGFTYKFTNGFNEDLKTFYIEYDGKQILTTENKMTLEKGEKHRFDVKYTFDKDNAEPKDYKVKIVPNISRDFDYTVNGEKYLFSKIGELTPAFDIVKGETHFELNLSKTASLSEVLKNFYGGKTVIVPSDAVKNNPYPFNLQVSSYNEKVTYNILFTFGEQAADNTGNTGNPNGGNADKPITPTEPVIPGKPDTPDTPDVPDTPTVPVKQKHDITYRIIGNENNLIQAEVLCVSSATAEETVNFSVSLIGDYKSEVTGITLYSGGKIWTTIDGGENDGASNFYKEYSFTMPDGDVEIVVTIKEIVVNEYHTLTYDTPGNDKYSILVYMADVAKAGDYVSIYIQLGLGEQDSMTISRVVLRNADTSKDIGGELEGYDGNYDFTMPDCNVVIMIYLTTGDSSYNDTPPATPVEQYYSVEYNLVGDATNLSDLSVNGTRQAKAGEQVNFTVNIGNAAYTLIDMTISVTNSSQVVEITETNGGYSFTMPQGNVYVRIYFDYTPPQDITMYDIEYDTLGSGSAMCFDLDCPDKAAAGDTVTFTVWLKDLSSGYDDYSPLEITRIVLNDMDTGEEIYEIGSGEGSFTFTMPDYPVTIIFYLMEM